MHEFAKAAFWALCTLAIYVLSRRIHRSQGRWWSSPLLLTWFGCGLLILISHTTYQEYPSGTHWLIWMLGPATVAFAIPIHRHRLVIRRHGLLLAIGVCVGSSLAVVSSWWLASYFEMTPEIRASLLPRSITTPLAMETASRIGGIPELTATFTAITGLFGAAIGDILLRFLPINSAVARGALFGMGAHGAGVAKALELGEEEGVVASLMMILAGQFAVIIASLITFF